MDVFCQVGEAVRPNRLVWLGDAADCRHWSRHCRTWLEWPQRRCDRDPDSEVAYVQQFHADVARRVRADEEDWVGGNHEARVAAWLKRNGPDVVGAGDCFEKRFDVAGLGFTYHPESMQYRGVGFLHGWFATASRTNAKRTYERYGKDCFVAHVHRDEEFVTRHAGSGLHGCTQTGCLCEVTPKWTASPDWHQSFLVVTFIRKQYHVERVRVIDGVGIYGGQRFVGKGS